MTNWDIIISGMNSIEPGSPNEAGLLIVMGQLALALQVAEKKIEELEARAPIPIYGGPPGIDIPLGPPHFPPNYSGSNYFLSERQPKTFDDIHQARWVHPETEDRGRVAE